MKWKFLNTGFNPGLFNMEFDLELASIIKSDEVFLRLYRWKPYCISLGANQSEESLLIDKIENDGLEIVKRPTGGRAILHSEELTYSVVYPLNNQFSARDLYREINLALKKGLAFFNSNLDLIKLEHYQPHFPSFYKKEESNLCFAVAAKYELNYKEKKLVGSAQRKIGNALLQHGSILCGDYHKKIIDYLNIDSQFLQKIKNDIDNTTISLSEILEEEINYSKLADSIRRGFQLHFETELVEIDSTVVLSDVMDK